ncbi:hypothetical protein BpHYR1_046544 [Brachionus plicatilis]|uniref:Uncharacterized protein n=1 Tax=Brachionus plicatilis TaxID=10195 RepID=A0A3M7RES2_BRAPC|nr:hypothetical protein BpHYR1_046544 [Brachionus plicatilis]
MSIPFEFYILYALYTLHSNVFAFLLRLVYTRNSFFKHLQLENFTKYIKVTLSLEIIKYMLDFNDILSGQDLGIKNEEFLCNMEMSNSASSLDHINRSIKNAGIKIFDFFIRMFIASAKNNKK